MDTSLVSESVLERGAVDASPLRPARGAARLPWLTLALTLTACAVAADLECIAWLEWRPEAWQAGQPWRWLTGHLTHYSTAQAGLNVGTMLLLGAALESISRRCLAWMLALAALAIPAALELGAPDLESYRGLSGLASGGFVLLVVLLGQRSRERGQRSVFLATLALGSLFLIKTAWEALTGDTVFIEGGDAGFIVVPIAHAVGAAVGLAVGCLSGLGKPAELHTGRSMR